MRVTPSHSLALLASGIVAFITKTAPGTHLTSTCCLKTLVIDSEIVKKIIVVVVVVAVVVR